MAWGLVIREPYQNRPTRYRYALTERGKSLEPVLKSIMTWGHAELGGGFFVPEDLRRSGEAIRSPHSSDPSTAHSSQSPAPNRAMPNLK